MKRPPGDEQEEGVGRSLCAFDEEEVKVGSEEVQNANTEEVQNANWSQTTCHKCCQMAEQINLSVKQMPKEGNSVALLCPTMRAVLNGQDMLMHQHSRQKIGQWHVGRKRLSLTTKIEQNKTT
jgi:predicted metalloprotease with PDZ domain